MNMIFSLIWFIIIFSVVVVSHEFGHFIVAKANGIRVKEFMVGFGPSIFKFQKGETLYKINILPLGGACVYDGMDEIEDDSNEDSDTTQGQVKDKSKFLNASPWAKLATLVAGPMFNFILGFIVAFIMVNMIVIREPIVTDVIEGGAAEAAGLQPGDRILALNGENIYLYDEISVFTSYYRGGEVRVKYERGEGDVTEIGEVTLTPYYNAEYGRYLIGITNDTYVEELHGFDAFRFTWYEMRYNVLMVWKGLGALITGNINRENVAGPVGMVNMVGDIIEETSPYGWQTVLVNMLNLTLLLTVNLGIFNLLPVPALDGGRILFALVEIVRGKPVPPKKEAYVHLAGMVLLLLIVVAVFFNDIHNIFN